MGCFDFYSLLLFTVLNCRVVSEPGNLAQTHKQRAASLSVEENRHVCWFRKGCGGPRPSSRSGPAGRLCQATGFLPWKEMGHMFFCQRSTSFLGFSVPRLTWFEASAPSRHTRPGEDRNSETYSEIQGVRTDRVSHFRLWADLAPQPGSPISPNL